MRFLASDIAALVDGTLVGPDVEVDGAAIDSRLLAGGELFVAIVGERDGHDFIPAATAGGAPAYLSAGPLHDGTAIVVADPARALTRLGQAARDRLPERVVGITGSVGKTTTKDLAAAALGARWRSHASMRSFNNEIGVPLTLVNAPGDTEATVVEMGARGVGHIDELCAIARPTIGVVTVVAEVHTEAFGDLAAVARAKGELIEALPATGTAVLNADDPLVAAMAERTDAEVLTFGLVGGEVRAEAVVVDADLRPRFDLRTPWGTETVRLAVRGEHNVGNALAAASVALVEGAPIEQVAAGLGAAAPSPWRMALSVAPSGMRVLDDCYNAGPASVAGALRALAHLGAQRPVAVLGVMAELGSASAAAHRGAGALAAELGIEVVAVGVGDYGPEPVPDVGAAFEALARIGPDAVLVKGSRVAGLERLVQRLLADG